MAKASYFVAFVAKKKLKGCGQMDKKDKSDLTRIGILFLVLLVLVFIVLPLTAEKKSNWDEIDEYKGCYCGDLSLIPASYYQFKAGWTLEKFKKACIAEGCWNLYQYWNSSYCDFLGEEFEVNVS